MNLNNTPSGGPLTSEDLDTWRRADMLGVDIDRVHKRHRSAWEVIDAPKRAATPAQFVGCTGPCDQGRKACPCPEACTEIGVERDDLSCASGIVWAVIVSLMVYAALTFVYLAFTS